MARKVIPSYLKAHNPSLLVQRHAMPAHDRLFEPARAVYPVLSARRMIERHQGQRILRIRKTPRAQAHKVRLVDKAVRRYLCRDKERVDRRAARA